jgi:hypothetical protein
MGLSSYSTSFTIVILVILLITRPDILLYMLLFTGILYFSLFLYSMLKDFYDRIL